MSKANLMEGVLHPSPMRLVRFPGGKVVALNRKDRRRMKLYGDRVTKVR